MFHRILSGNDHKRSGQFMSVIIHRHLEFTHCFEQRTLRLWSGAVDFIRKNNVCEEWAAFEQKFLVIRVPDRNSNDVGWQKIGCKLNAMKIAGDRFRKSLRKRCFADARDILDQKMSGG